MGGYGSGMWRFSRRPLAETMRRIDLATLRRDKPSLTAIDILQVRCQRSDGKRIEVTEVYLEATRVYFGGHRLWFRCPRCDGRCRVLYGTWRIACRRCHRLRYTTQKETRSGRANLAMFKIVKRLDPDATFNELPPKPKGMHWCTYERLADRYDAYDTMWAMAIMRHFRIGRR